MHYQLGGGAYFYGIAQLFHAISSVAKIAFLPLGRLTIGTVWMKLEDWPRSPDDGDRLLTELSSHVWRVRARLIGFVCLKASVVWSIGDSNIVSNPIGVQNCTKWNLALDVTEEVPIHDETFQLNDGLIK